MNWITKTLAAALVVVPTVAFPQQSSCDDRDTVISYLQERYSEENHAIALDKDDWLVDILVNEETGTWTIVLTQPDSLSCIVAFGSNWEIVDSPKGDDT